MTQEQESFIKYVEKDSPTSLHDYVVGFHRAWRERINSVWHSYKDAKKADLDKKDLVIAYHPKVNKFFIGTLFLSHYYRTNPETGVTTKIPEVAIKYDRCMEAIFTDGVKWAYLKDLMPEEEYK